MSWHSEDLIGNLQMSKSVEEWIVKGTTQIFSKTWVPNGAIAATVLFMHGLGEHCSRYDHLFTFFAQQGIKVIRKINL